MACPGVYKAGPDNSIGKCYTYDVLTAVCFELGLQIDADTGKESWIYKGGCFENDNPLQMERAIPGQIYQFEHIPI